MAHEEDKHSLEAKFTAAVKVIRSLPEEGPFQPSDDMMLMFYSYYKQATSGPCNIPRPNGFWDTHGKTKWDAWSSLGNMTKEEAMKNYLEHIQLILETIPISEEVSNLVQMLGNFYTEVEREGEAEDPEVDCRPFTRPFADEPVKQFIKPTMEDYRPTPRLLMVDRRWRCDPRGSSSSMEPSVSSFTNGTHSSLNSEMEEEELACSMEPSVHYDSYVHFNGHLNGPSDAVPEKIHRSTDSDNEEFCDSMEHVAMEEVLTTSKMLSPGSGAASVRNMDLWFENNTGLQGGEAQVMGDCYLEEGISASQHSNNSVSRSVIVSGSQLPRTTCSSQQCASVDSICCGMSQSRHSISTAKGNVNEQIATALLRLQHDMAVVLHRLHALEALTASQSRSSSPRQEDCLPIAQKFSRPSWWPFDFSPLTAVLTAVWPLVAHWLVQLYFQRRRRKIP